MTEGLGNPHRSFLSFRRGTRRIRFVLATLPILAAIDTFDFPGVAQERGSKSTLPGKAAVDPDLEIVPENLPPLESPVLQPTIPDDQVLAIASSLSLESRRYLLYLNARLNRPHVSEALAERILVENPGDQRTLLVLASMYLERRSAEKAMEIARTLIAYYPDDDQSRYFLGASYYLSQQYDAAKEVFKDLKVSKFRGRLYPYETDLASSALRSGDWFSAKQSYEEVLRSHKLHPSLRLEARRILESVYREHLPLLTLSNTTAILNSGSLHRPGASFRTHIEDRQTLHFSVGTTMVRIEPAPSLRKYEISTLEGRAALESVWRKQWHTTAWIGGSEILPLGGMQIKRNLGDQRAAWLEFHGNEKSQDGLLIESLNGRQHRIAVGLTHTLHRNLTFQGELSVRDAHIDHESLGQGLQFYSTFDYTLKRGWPEWHAGWRSYISLFSRDPGANPQLPFAADNLTPERRRDLISQLVLSDLHREGVYVNVRHQLSGLVYLRAGGGVDYALDRSTFEYYGQGGISVYPRKRLELDTGLTYSTSARTADQNSAQWLLDFSLKYWF